MKWRPTAGVALAMGLVLSLGSAGFGRWCALFNLARPDAAHAATVREQPDSTGCAGDCRGDGHVAIDEILLLVNIALGYGQADSCAVADADRSQQITVNEIIAAVNNALIGCPPTPAPTATPTEVPTETPTEAPTSTPIPLPTATPTVPLGGTLTVAQAVARYGNGVAIQLNQTVTTEGVVTVSAGLLANNKLKIFLQSDARGIEVYNQTSANVSPGDFEQGQRCRVTGVVRQADPAADSDVLNGTVLVDVSAGSWAVLSGGNPLSAPQTTTLHNLMINGIPYVGVLVQVAHVQKISGNWPVLGGKSTSVMISDDGGTTQLPLRFQKNTITAGLVNELKAIGNGQFNVGGIAAQNAPPGGSLLGNFEIWVRGAEDINP